MGKKVSLLAGFLVTCFVITFAGHDTTANTLAFAMPLPAAQPEVQAWLAEEIAAVQSTLDGDAAVENRDYHAMSPQLKRFQAVLLETSRLCPPSWLFPSGRRERHKPSKSVSKTTKC